MSVRQDGSSPVALDELATLTAAYARYSRTAFGFAAVLTGGWVLAALAVASWGSRAVGELFVHATPLVWLEVVVRARAHYQRRGEVVQQEIPNRSFQPTLRRYALAGIYVASLLGILGRIDSASGVDPFAIADVAILVAIPARAALVTRGVAEVNMTMVLGMLGVVWSKGHLEPWVLAGVSVVAWALAALSVVLIASGTVQHVRHRRIERRLRAVSEAMMRA